MKIRTNCVHFASLCFQRKASVKISFRLVHEDGHIHCEQCVLELTLMYVVNEHIGLMHE